MYGEAHKERESEGFVEFRTYTDMKRALEELDGMEILGRRIRLREDRFEGSTRVPRLARSR